MQLEGKIALVTGASRGIGKAIAVALAAAGADVAVNYAGNKAAAEAVAAEIEAMGRKVLLLQGDVAQLEVCTEMIDAVIKEFGRIDILVNNAGITRDNLLMRMKEEDWDAVLNTNLKGVFNCTKAAVKYMTETKSGPYRQHHLCRRCNGQCRSGQLCCSKSRLHRFHQICS